MPICTLHLVHLSVNLPAFLKQLSNVLEEKPLVVARVVRWIIRPETIDVSALLDHPWDLLLILPGEVGLPGSMRTPNLVRQLYTVKAGVPSALVKSFAEKNEKLLSLVKDEIPVLTGSLDKPKMANSSQNLEMSPELLKWIPSWETNSSFSGQGAVSMLNFLAFRPGKREEYIKYGKAFADSIGKRRGGDAKVVGKVIPEEEGKEQKKQWEEIALAHYPSIRHFADMAASKDYQEVNHRHRIGSLEDTCILMTSEVDIPTLKFKKPKANL